MKQLTDYIQRPLEPFQRGVSDCCAWAMGWASQLCGEELGGAYLKPMTGGQAIQLLRKHGGIYSLAQEVLGDADFHCVRDSFQDGDIVIIRHSKALLDETIGIVNASKFVSVHEKGGITISELTEVKGGWRWV